MSNRKSRRTQRIGGRPAPGASLRRGKRLPVALLLAPLLLALGLGGWRAVADSLPSIASASAPAAAQLTRAAAASPVPPAPAAVPATGASASVPAAPPAASPASHGQWVLAPDALPTPAFPGDVPPLPAARSAQDPGFHPDLVLGTRAEGGTVTLTCQNPATGRREVIVGRAGRNRVFALADPQAAFLPTAPVQSVAAGALVASRDPATGASGYGRVTATVSRPAPALVSLSLSDPQDGKAEALTCTPEHPLYVSGKGWVEAGDLGVGTSIVTRAGPPVVVKVVSWQRDETGKKPFTVYNLTVQGDHTYFAGALDGGAWAHNLCDITPGLAKVKQIHDERFMDNGYKANRVNSTAVLETTAGDYVGMSGNGLHAEEDAIAQARADGLADNDLLAMNVNRRPCPGRCTPLLQGMGLTTRYWYRFKTWQAPW